MLEPAIVVLSCQDCGSRVKERIPQLSPCARGISEDQQDQYGQAQGVPIWTRSSQETIRLEKECLEQAEGHAQEAHEGVCP
jgi:hypothetical protein